MAESESKLAAEAIAAIQKAVEELPDACERLKYVKQLTQSAANKVFDLSDAVQADAKALLSLADQVAPEHQAALRALAEKQQGLATELMMSQDFQDLSGQVVNKVIALMQSVERPLEAVLEHAGRVEAAVQDDALAGVQTPDKALKQDDVDDLLASLGF
ncbi:protein phosphatase CheZ [Inhella gelatinilytica]|uniref:Protein phosphatase CheZ n=1 Tax=Inhella gelatinilytica TaxID=2795030 RepID=A0A931ISW5_9BURK|nr:protein phosphatase CheZ [Inhella gelatinilytica]MBH9551397.1 protein phosphatase CheZ [Inhella gelatinilytica]